MLPLGSTEQHAHLSLGTDAILAERVAVEAAEPLGVPVFPALPYGISPYFRAYPGSVSLRVETYLSIVRDILDSLAHSGFRRILLVNGHGGNAPAQALAGEWMADHPGVRVRFHDWWRAPRTWAKVLEIDPVASHGSWMENFPWTRLAGVALPGDRKPMVDLDRVRLWTRRRCAPCSATATTAVTISARTPRWTPSGRWPCRKPGRCWNARGRRIAVRRW